MHQTSWIKAFFLNFILQLNLKSNCFVTKVRTEFTYEACNVARHDSNETEAELQAEN